MKVVDIEKIVGKKNYARLKKYNAADAQKLSVLSEEEVMALAGIGPKTAHRLFKALGRNVSEKEITKKYNRLSIRTRLQNIKLKVREFKDNPQPLINKIDRVREGAIASRNFLASVYNFGRPQEERVKNLDYFPSRLELNEDMLRTETEKTNKFFMQVNLNREANRFNIKSKLFNLDTLEEWSSSDDIVPGVNLNPTSLQEIINIIRSIYNSYREKSHDGLFVVILDSDMIPVADKLKDLYASDITNQIFTVVDNQRQYMEWEVILKYVNNRSINSMLEKLSNFILFFKYNENVRAGRNVADFDEYKKLNYNPSMFWDKIDVEPKKAITSILSNVDFGIAEAGFGFYGFKTESYDEVSIPDITLVKIPETFEQFKDQGREIPIDIYGKPVSLHIIAMVNLVFDRDFKIWFNAVSKPIVFTSNKYPDWGFIVK